MRHALTAALLFYALGSYGVAHTNQASGWKSGLLAWRASHAKSVAGPDGWLAVVGLEWLDAGDNSFGSAPDNRIRIAGPVAAHLGILRLDHDRVSLLAPPGGFPRGLLLDQHTPRPEKLNVGEKPTLLSDGTVSLLVIHRGDRYALRIRDSQAPARLGFHGLHWYAPDARYRIRAQWIPWQPARKAQIPTVLGTTIELSAPGRAEFTLGGQRVTLEPVLESDHARTLFFILRDATSRTTTYGASRFLYTDFPDHGLNQPGTLWLDFNRLENPPCAYTPYATCPLPPPQNRLSIAIPAGERRYHP